MALDMRFEETHLLTYNHIDNHNIARPSTAFDLMQDAATNHSLEMGVDKDTLGVFWVLSRMKLWQQRPFYPEEAVTVATWCEGVRGVSWCRGFSLSAGEEQVARAISTWITLDPETHKILRPANVAASSLFPALSRDFPIPGKLSCEYLKLHHVHTVRYSDLDRNNHLNNAKIVDIIADGMNFDRRYGYFVSEIQVNYTAECKCGEQIALSVGIEEGGMIYVFARTEEEGKFEAAARLSKY